MANQKNTDTEVTTEVVEEPTEETIEPTEEPTEITEPVAEESEEEVVEEPTEESEVTEDPTEEPVDPVEPTHSIVEEVTKPKARWKKSDGDTESWSLIKEEFVNESNLEVVKYVWEHTDKEWEVTRYDVMTITKTSGGKYVEIVLAHQGKGWLVRFTGKEVLDQINKVISKLWATMDDHYTVTFNWMSIGWRTISFLAH